MRGKKKENYYTCLHKKGAKPRSKNKKVKKKDFYLTIFNLMKQGKNPSLICRMLSLSKQRMNYYISALKKLGFIRKVGYGTWEVKDKITEKELDYAIYLKGKNKSSLGTTIKPITNLHAFQIKFPILEGKIRDSDWEVKEKLNNWIPKYHTMETLGGIVIKNNNNKSLTVWLKMRNIANLNEVYDLAFKIRAYMYEYFKKQGVILDVFNCETKNLDLATEDENSKGMLGKGEKFRLKLNKKSEKIFPKDNIDANAWLDGSPFEFTAETNDLEWKREYLSMPFRLRDTFIAMNYIAKNYASHVRLVEKASKVMDKLDRKLSRKNIKKTEDNQTTLDTF